MIDNEEFWSVYEKVLRADYKILENYEYQKNSDKLNCSVSVIGGKEDSLTSYEDLKMWKSFIAGSFNLKCFEGNHFYLFEKPEPIVKYIKMKLSR